MPTDASGRYMGLSGDGDGHWLDGAKKERTGTAGKAWDPSDGPSSCQERVLSLKMTGANSTGCGVEKEEGLYQVASSLLPLTLFRMLPSLLFCVPSLDTHSSSAGLLL